MKRAAGILALVLLISLLSTSDVRGAGGLVSAGKTTGASLTATIVTDVTGGTNEPGKGLTSIRVQKSSKSAAVLFTSSYVASLGGQCIPDGFDLQGGTNNRFVGLMDGWVDEPGVLDSLLVQFGNPKKAAITDTDYASCTAVTHHVLDASGNIVSSFVRQILSFTAVIQFQP